jgi:hypothetical protein
VLPAERPIFTGKSGSSGKILSLQMLAGIVNHESVDTSNPGVGAFTVFFAS